MRYSELNKYLIRADPEKQVLIGTACMIDKFSYSSVSKIFLSNKVITIVPCRMGLVSGSDLVPVWRNYKGEMTVGEFKEKLLDMKADPIVKIAGACMNNERLISGQVKEVDVDYRGLLIFPNKMRVNQYGKVVEVLKRSNWNYR